MSTLVGYGGAAVVALLVLLFSIPAALYGSSASQRAGGMRVLTASAVMLVISIVLFVQHRQPL